MAATFSTAVYIEAPPDAVFEALGNLESAEKWMPNFVRIEKLTPGPVGAGTEWRETRKMFGKEATEHFLVTRWERPKRVGIQVDGSKGTSGRGEYLFTYDLEPERNGTNVELAGEVRMGGVWGVFGKMMIGTFKKACHKDLEALKAHLESQGAGVRGQGTAARGQGTAARP